MLRGKLKIQYKIDLNETCRIRDSIRNTMWPEEFSYNTCTVAQLLQYIKYSFNAGVCVLCFFGVTARRQLYDSLERRGFEAVCLFYASDEDVLDFMHVCPQLAKLTRLSLRCSSLSDRALEALVGACPKLTWFVLILRYNRIRNINIKAIALNVSRITNRMLQNIENLSLSIVYIYILCIMAARTIGVGHLLTRYSCAS